MAKSTQHIDKLGTYDTFRAPWESEAGGDADVDKPTLKRLVFNLKKDLATARDSHEDTKATLTEVEGERDDAKKQAADGDGAEAQKKIDKLTAERDDYKAKVEGFEAATALADLRKEVLGDFEAANPKAAKYVVGTTKEELEESLAAVKEDFGISDEPGDDDEDIDPDDEPVVRTTPRTRTIVNPADKANGKGGEVEIDFDKVAGEVLSGGRVFG